MKVFMKDIRPRALKKTRTPLSRFGYYERSFPMWIDCFIAIVLLVWVAGLAVAIGSMGVMVWLLFQTSPVATLRALAWALVGCGAMLASWLIATIAIRRSNGL